MDTILQEAEKAARRELAELIAGVKAENVRIRSDVIHGRVYKAILQYAALQKADLIVMGTHGRTGLEYAFFGSVAERVIRGAPCPVLIVPRPRGREQS
jgi:nucleotide-binding universal stress UspA family protein